MTGKLNVSFYKIYLGTFWSCRDVYITNDVIMLIKIWPRSHICFLFSKLEKRSYYIFSLVQLLYCTWFSIIVSNLYNCYCSGFMVSHLKKKMKSKWPNVQFLKAFRAHFSRTSFIFCRFLASLASFYWKIKFSITIT